MTDTDPNAIPWLSMKDFIAFQIPTLEQHRAASAAWYERIGPCLYENWPQALRNLSFRTVSIELTPEDQEEMLAAFDNAPTPHALALTDRIDAALTGFENGAFVKLSSRSAKDAWCETFKCVSGADVLNQFSSSERILDDLVQYKYLDHPCYLLLRDWADIPKHEEWRCFVRDGRIIGVSQYHYLDDFTTIYGNDGALYDRIVTFVESAAVPVLPCDPVVVDVWLRPDPMVIEINPYGLSDPCLFDYAELEAGVRGLRVLGAQPA